jgi:hypothetical protein
MRRGSRAALWNGACRVLPPSGAIRRQQRDGRPWQSIGSSTLAEAPLEPGKSAARPTDAPRMSRAGNRLARKRPRIDPRRGRSRAVSRRESRMRTKPPERARRMSLSATHRPRAPGTTLPGIDAPLGMAAWEASAPRTRGPSASRYSLWRISPPFPDREASRPVPSMTARAHRGC